VRTAASRPGCRDYYHHYYDPDDYHYHYHYDPDHHHYNPDHYHYNPDHHHYNPDHHHYNPDGGVPVGARLLAYRVGWLGLPAQRHQLWRPGRHGAERSDSRRRVDS
jgi:hypothetical protein